MDGRELLSGLAVELQAPVVLVVGMKLGCISHALLTVDAIKADGLRLAGWVANRIDPDMSCFEENVSTLKALIPAPCLGVVPYLDGDERGFNKVAEFLEVSIL